MTEPIVHSQGMQKAKTIVVWVLQALLCLQFTLVGTGKFMDRVWAPRFRNWGYPEHFYQVIGVLELLGGLSLLVPRLAGYGAAVLMVIMIGATATHLVHGERWTSPVFPLVLLSVVAATRLRFRRRQDTAAVNHSTRTA